MFTCFYTLVAIDRLKEADLCKVKNALWSVRCLWRGIGENLGVVPHDLDEIEKKERADPGNCLGQVLLKWLRRASTTERPITWIGLVAALQMEQLRDDCGAVVEEIKLKYNPVLPLKGKLN